MGTWKWSKKKGSALTLSSFHLGKLLIALTGPFSIFLGYKLLILGIVENSFTFTAELKGWKLGLASSGPGLFFALCGLIITVKSKKLFSDKSS